jgi:lysosomal acid phosphatase
MVTPNGLKQSYDLGVYIKNYYKSFLDPVYSSYNLYARSTDWDRTLLSAETFLAGVYQPMNGTQWPWNQAMFPNWLPIPVHSRAIDTDPVLLTIFVSLLIPK